MGIVAVQYREEGVPVRECRIFLLFERGEKGYWFLFVVGLLLLTRLAGADCLELKSSQDILDCALGSHPAVLQAQTRSAQGQSLEAVASQRPNPELDANTVFGSSQGMSVVNSQVVLAHTFEMGGKRGSRIEKAQAEREVITTEVLKAKEEVALSVVAALFRLRQLKGEIGALNEALYTFTQIKGQLKSRPKLTPEQRVAFSIFKLAESDYTLRRTSLEGQERSLLKLIEVAIGKPFQIKNELLPQAKEKWPEIQESEDIQAFSGSDFSRLRAELKSAQADLSLAQSDSWPNLKIGPEFQAQTQGGIAYQAFGLSLALPLPLYQANGGGRTYATLGLGRAETALHSGSDLLKTERNRELAQYHAALKALQQASTLREVEKEHQSVEELFKGGLIQSSLVIEAHRQIVDLTRNVNEQELAAIRALWRIYAIDGRVLKEKL